MSSRCTRLSRRLFVGAGVHDHRSVGFVVQRYLAVPHPVVGAGTVLRRRALGEASDIMPLLGIERRADDALTL